MSEQGRIEYSPNLSLWGDWVQTHLHRSHHYTNAPPLNCNLRFLGQYEDKESGLYYNRYRYYNPTLAQYISPDPIGLLGGFNPYGYVAIPTISIDPLGLELKYVVFPPENVIKQVVIPMQGYRDGDFKMANKISGIMGTRGKPTIHAHKILYGEVTWHHMDYNPVTNEATMQLVKTSDHISSLPHKGSVKAFEEVHNISYDTDKSKELAKKLNYENNYLKKCKKG